MKLARCAEQARSGRAEPRNGILIRGVELTAPRSTYEWIRILLRNSLWWDTTVRFMMMVRANRDSEAGVMPQEKLIAAMGKYNEELAKAGVLIDGAGLQPSSK